MCESFPFLLFFITYVNIEVKPFVIRLISLNIKSGNSKHRFHQSQRCTIAYTDKYTWSELIHESKFNFFLKGYTNTSILSDCH